MFGFLQIHAEILGTESKERYHAVYCGLCQRLRERHGQIARLSLTYDLTFLILLLSSLYEPSEQAGTHRCLLHPTRKMSFTADLYTDYAADMTIALMYHKCLDDWRDDRKPQRKYYASLLRPHYHKVSEMYPAHCQNIERWMQEIICLEEQTDTIPDAPANCFGELMRSVFLYHADHFSQDLGGLGYHLGRYIYLADAAIDRTADARSGSFNPFSHTSFSDDDIRSVLMNILGEASICFENLPLEQDWEILSNILYSGIWAKFNSGMKEKGGKDGS